MDLSICLFATVSLCFSSSFFDLSWNPTKVHYNCAHCTQILFPVLERISTEPTASRPKDWKQVFQHFQSNPTSLLPSLTLQNVSQEE